MNNKKNNPKVNPFEYSDDENDENDDKFTLNKSIRDPFGDSRTYSSNTVQGNSNSTGIEPGYMYPDNPFVLATQESLELQSIENGKQNINRHANGQPDPLSFDPPVAASFNTTSRIDIDSFAPPRSFYPVDQNPNSIKKILFGKRTKGWPYFTYIVTLIQIVVFCYEFIKMGIYTGNPFQTEPYFNPMLGPSSYVQINVGARYLPCMTFIEGITDYENLQWPCPNSTSTSTNVCSLGELCGMGGISNSADTGFPDPNQWWRLITPMFLHAGLLHIFFNMFLQIVMGAKVERYIGTLRFGFIYLASGISGFLLGANFTPMGISSSGASGALFGACISLNLLLLLLNNSVEHHDARVEGASRKQYKVLLFGLMIEIIIMIFLGLLPGLDNFSHIGGFVIGLALGIALLNDPICIYTDEYKNYRQFKRSSNALDIGTFMENRDKKKFIIWCVLRVVCFVLAIVYFVMLGKNFHDKGAEASESCSWCKYINCLPVNGWCEQGELSITTSSFSPFFAFELLLFFIAKKFL